MSELCKIESPISLHLMSLNFERKKGDRGETVEESWMRGKGGGGGEQEPCTVLGKFIRYKSGCKCL